MPIAPGARVTDKVSLVRRLGEGAMGEVWVGLHETLKTEVAVKFISEELVVLHPESAKRFSIEAEAAAKIKSPHVVRTFDHGVTSEGIPYIVMELLEGMSLQQRLDERGVFDVGEMADVLRQVAKALDAAHAHGIIHRDLKPHNVFIIDQQGEPFVKLLDFGSAKHVEAEDSVRLTLPGMVVGTPEYINPELVEDPGAVTAGTDLWALGVVTYKCLTGEVPFKGAGILEVCDAIAAGKFRRPSRVRSDLPVGLDQWFARVFSHEPARRPQSGMEMARSFDEAAHGLTENVLVPLPRVSKLRERLSFAALGLSLVVAVGAVLWTQRGRDETSAGAPNASATESETASSAPSASAPAKAAPRGSVATSASGDAPDGGFGGADGAGGAVAAIDLDAAGGSSAGLSSARASDDLIRALAEKRVVIPAGEFWMGCDETKDRDCVEDEKPGRIVSVGTFAIDITEVSVALYMLCVQKGGCSANKINGYALEGGPFVPTTKCNWGHATRRNHPMNCVDHTQAATYCRWVDARLPSEAEWEKAARGKDKRLFPWGADPPSCSIAVMSEGTQGCRANGTWPVGSKRGGASAYKVLNMAGNVREWVADWYEATYYAKAPAKNPPGPPQGSKRVGRGGSWGTGVGKFMRTSVREGLLPSTRSIQLGFRCAANVDG